MKEEEKASEDRQKGEAEEADQVEAAPGVTLARLRRFRAALLNTHFHTQTCLGLISDDDR